MIRFLGISRQFMHGFSALDNSYKAIRNKQYPPDATILGFADSLNKMNEIRLANYTYMLSLSYKQLPEFNKAYQSLEEILTPKLKSFNDTTFNRIVRNILYAYRQSYKKFTREFLIEILNRTRNYKTSHDKLALMAHLAKLIGQFRVNNIEYEAIFLEYLRDCDLEVLRKSSAEEAILILEILAQLSIQNNEIKAVAMNGVELLEFIHLDVINRVLGKELTVVSAAQVLKNYLLCNYTHEEFIRNLEDIVIQNLGELDDILFSQLLISYKERRFHDYYYIINTVYKQFYEELLSRFEKMKYSHKSQFLFHYWQGCTFYGLYCDSRIFEKILKLFENPQEIMEMSVDDRIRFLLNILTFCNHAGFIENDQLINHIYTALEPTFCNLDNKLLLTFANAFSRNRNTPTAFWFYLKEKIPEIMRKSEKLTYLYSIHLNLSLQNPEVYEIIKPEIIENIENLKNYWLIERKKDILIHDSSQVHKDLEKALEKKNVSYTSEYFDEYFIDVAVLSHKIAYEVLGPGHYIFPEKTLNGRTLNKKKNLEKLGWTYHEIPFFIQRNNDRIFENKVATTLPLKY